MKNNVTKLFFGIYLFSLFFGSVEAVKMEHAKWWGLGVGSAAGLVTAGGVYYVWSGNKFVPVCGGKLAGSAALGVGVGGLAGYIAYRIALSNTPEARFEKAKEIIQNVWSDSLIGLDFTDSARFISMVNMSFGTSWPLVLGRQHFENKRNQLRSASYLIHRAHSEASKDYNLSWICDKCDELKRDISDILRIIEYRMNLIFNSYDYRKQVKIYEKYLEEEKKREHDRIERSKDRNAKLYMHSQKIRQKDKNRDAKLQMHRIEMKQKDRNRKLLQKVSSQENVDINFNVNNF